MSENTPETMPEQGENRGDLPHFTDTLKRAGGRPMVKKSQGLPARHSRFAVAYLQSLNATDAARKAGYKGENLSAIGSRLLRREPVKRFIGERLAQAMDGDTVILKAQILKLWQEFMQNHELPPMVRLKATEYLAKYCGLFEQGHSLTINGPGFVYVNWPELPETARE